MTESNTEKLDVQLNDAFSRLEKQQGARSGDDQRPPSNSGTSGVVSFAAMLLSLLAIGIASYGAFIAYQLQQQPVVSIDNTVEPRLAQMNQQLDKVTKQLATVEATSSEKFARLLTASGDQQADQLTAIESRMTSLVDSLKQELGTSSEDWLLAEAEYLLRLGNQRVMMEQDVAGALALFQSADNIIRDAEGIVAFELRQALAEDIASLQSVQHIDVDGYFVQLGAMIKQVDKLQQKQLEFHVADLPEVETEVAPTLMSRFLALVERGGARLASLVDYRRDGELISPILPPQEEYYLRQNLMMQFQLAQLGLLQGKQAVFDASLEDAMAWLGRSFDQEDKVTISLKANVAALQGVSVTRQTPDVSNSLREIKKLMARFHQQPDRGESATDATGPGTTTMGPG